MNKNYISVDHLPKKQHAGKICIDWKKSIHYNINFKYKNTLGKLTIISYITKPDSIVQVKYGKYYYWISTTNLLKCRLGFINNVIHKRPDLIKYFVNIDDAINNSSSSTKIFDMKCDKCGTPTHRKISDLSQNGICCKKCGDGISYPEKIMRTLLVHLNISFTQEMKIIINGINRFFDFTIESKKLIIEMDGGFHYKPRDNSKSIKEIQKVDNDKNKWALSNGYNIIRINSVYSNLEYIKNNILNSDLNSIFNLSEIDWMLVGIESEKSLMIDVCNYKNNYPEIFSTEISKIFNISKSTVVRYLKRGSELHLCVYNENDESIRQIGNDSKPIVVLKDNIIIKEYDSISKCVNQSLIDFGVQFNKSNICGVCMGRKSYHSHKGYTFKYK